MKKRYSEEVTKLNKYWIYPKQVEKEGNVHVFRQTVTIKKGIKNAVLYVTALGMYDVDLNGIKVGDIIFAPGYTYYPLRTLYQTYDVTKQLNIGENEFLFFLAQGWYCGYFTCWKKYQIYGEKPAISWNLVLEYEDGTINEYHSLNDVDEIASPYAYASLYNGEEYYADGNVPQNVTSGLALSNPKKHGKKPGDGRLPKFLDATETAVKLQDEMVIKEVKQRGNSVILDFGQNFAGMIEIHPEYLQGDEVVTIHHAEILNKDGSMCLENLRTAKAKIIYHAGKNKSIYRPRFTYMGFRYVEISGAKWVDGLITARAIHNDMQRTGEFTCTNEKVERLYKNQLWGQKSNYVAIPTDCPQRDEREGYTGDAQVYCKTGSYNYDVRNFWRQYLRDMELGQQENAGHFVGMTVPVTGPTKSKSFGGIGWGNAVTIIPEIMYQQYGDVSFLSNQYESMKNFVDGEIGKMKNHLTHTISLGDWLCYKRSLLWMMLHNGPISNSYVVHDLDVMVKSARLLGKKEDERKYYNQYLLTREAYIKKYVTKDGIVANDYQSAYVMALAYVIPKGSLREKVQKKLLENLKKNGMQIGFLAVRFLLPLLVEMGEEKLAYDFLLNESCGGWMYQVNLGATTIWERWDSLKEDGSLNESKVLSDNMVSFNHYAFGSVGEFYYNNILGIQAMKPGYEEIRIKPILDKRLGYVAGYYDSVSGRVAVEWDCSDNEWTISVNVPVASTIELPDGRKECVQAGTYKYHSKKM